LNLEENSLRGAAAWSPAALAQHYMRIWRVGVVMSFDGDPVGIASSSALPQATLRGEKFNESMRCCSNGEQVVNPTTFTGVVGI
jgi:hypothetical protein